MRLRSAPAIALGVAAVTMAPATVADAASPSLPALAMAPVPGADQEPSCGDPDSADFPIRTRLRGGPGTYEAGGGFRNWYLELTNATGESCHNIHPVIVMVTDGRDREPTSDKAEDRARFEFYDDGAERWRSVPFEKTDADEYIGVFGHGFTGFTVAAGKTVTVKVRLAFAAGARPGDVVANAAVVQRHGDDGEWVGESNDYRFAVTGRSADHDRDPDSDPSRDAERDPERDADPDVSSSPDAELDPAPDPGDDDDRTPPIAKLPDRLAMTGRTPASLLTLGATAGALLLAGGALMVGSRRLRAAATRRRQ
ncbi:hypothetical protein [Streptomyces sp. ISL-100]|uniref:hypothetical protein n=1 Tax=Streptomyces sp. ISL-100 TaxID=2819173 RepID=UPI001BEA4075|nr:hypothetical protein [Streptomyces sp. ISL-100]MBT2395533.1 hypothetical protein [Streptomyces sp. ISL-100]